MNRQSPTSIALWVALLAGIVLGTAVVVSRYAYNDGASGILVASVRALIMTVVVGIGLRIAGIDWRLPPSLIGMAAVNGSLMALMTYGNIGAVEFISVGLASLLFFTFPIIIAVIVTVLKIEQIRPGKVAAILAAFAGLVIMLGTSLGEVDLRGTLLSLMAALATAINAVLLARHFRRTNVFVTTFHFSLVSLVALLIMAIIFGDVRYPQGIVGWAGVCGVGVLQTIGTPMYLYAIAQIGALKAGMATNIQPVAAIFEAWVLFGELLSGPQALGGVIVLASIAAMQWLDLRRATIDSANRSDN